MAITYLTDPRTGTVYELIATLDDQVWVRRQDDGIMESRPAASLAPHDLRPNRGEVWIDDATGEDVVIFGRFETIFYAVLLLPNGQEVPDPTVAVRKYTRGELRPKRRASRHRDAALPVTPSVRP